LSLEGSARTTSLQFNLSTTRYLVWSLPHFEYQVTILSFHFPTELRPLGEGRILFRSEAKAFWFPSRAHQSDCLNRWNL
jgi:hypothetical protein